MSESNIETIDKDNENSRGVEELLQNSKSFLPNETCRESSENIEKVSSATQIGKLDIGFYIGKSVNDMTKRNLLLNPWTPPKNYEFSYSVHLKKGKEEKRYARQSHLDSFDWLLFSDIEKGFFCKYCPFFVTGSVGGFQKNVPLQALVTKPLQAYANLL